MKKHIGDTLEKAVKKWELKDSSLRAKIERHKSGFFYWKCEGCRVREKMNDYEGDRPPLSKVAEFQITCKKCSRYYPDLYES